MAEGIVAEVAELIDLRRYVQSVFYPSQGKALRSGNHLSKLRGRGMDFSEVRNYQPGDEIRHMEWRVTARTGRPHIKLYQEERERPVVVLADFNPSMNFGTRIALKSVVAARLASLIAWTVVKQGDRVGGFFFSSDNHSEFVPRSRESGVLPLLAALSDYTVKTSRDFTNHQRKLSEALSRMRRVVRPGSILVLISDFYCMDAESEKLLGRLSEHNDILVYHVCDRLELEPPSPQQYAITNGQQDMILDTRAEPISEAYHQYCSDRNNTIQSQCKWMRLQYVQVTADMDLPRLVRATFPRRSRA